LDTRANLTDLIGCFEDLYIMSSKEERNGCTDATEAGSYDCDLIAISWNSRSKRTNETGLASFTNTP
jgi:hypothetical protein